MNVIKKMHNKAIINRMIDEASELCNLTYKRINNDSPNYDELVAFTYAYIILKDEELFKEITSNKEEE